MHNSIENIQLSAKSFENLAQSMKYSYADEVLAAHVITELENTITCNTLDEWKGNGIQSLSLKDNVVRPKIIKELATQCLINISTQIEKYQIKNLSAKQLITLADKNGHDINLYRAMLILEGKNE